MPQNATQMHIRSYRISNTAAIESVQGFLLFCRYITFCPATTTAHRVEQFLA